MNDNIRMPSLKDKLREQAEQKEKEANKNQSERKKRLLKGRKLSKKSKK